MDINREINIFQTKNESVILKENKEDKSLRATTDLTDQNIIESQKNDIISSLTKNTMKKKHHYYNKGKLFMFLFNKDDVPRIVIGPDCKRKNNINI